MMIMLIFIIKSDLTHLSKNYSSHNCVYCDEDSDDENGK